MLSKIKITVVVLVSFLIFIGAQIGDNASNKRSAFGPETPLSKVLLSLKDDKPFHYKEQFNEDLIQKGREIVFNGRTKDSNGKLTSVQSKHFKCTNCHNTVREDPNLTISDPEARLDYASKNSISFLPGTTLYGVVNRSSWYNDDYSSKYGDLVTPARDTLINAIQLCAVQCSQGRALENWEMEAVLAYLYSIELKLGDLNLSEKEQRKLEETISQGRKSEDMIALIKSKYLQGSPATFLAPVEIKERKYGEGGDSKNGALIYELSCMKCHKEGGVTNFVLDNDQLTFKYLQKHLKKKSNKSVYQITRKGTYSIPGYKPYMPNYTEERMSKQQLEDLVFYIKIKADELKKPNK